MEWVFAKIATGESINSLLLPCAAAGRVNTPTSSCSEENIHSKVGKATLGVPANKIRTNYQNQKLDVVKSGFQD